MSYRQIELTGKTDFDKGFMAALDFLDGADPYQIIHSDATSVTIDLKDDDDHCSYVIEAGRVRFESGGVEL